MNGTTGWTMPERSEWKERSAADAAAMAKHPMCARFSAAQLALAFDWDELARGVRTPESDELLGTLALSVEVAAIEGLDALRHPSPENGETRETASIAARGAFCMGRARQLPKEESGRMLHVLHLAALAVVGDCGPELRSWFLDHRAATSGNGGSATAPAEWDLHLLRAIFDSWAELMGLRPDGAASPGDDIRDRIDRVRAEQKTREATFLASSRRPRPLALRLMALYHWAKATELLVRQERGDGLDELLAEVEERIGSAVTAAEVAGDAMLATAIKWLHAAGRIIAEERAR